MRLMKQLNKMVNDLKLASGHCPVDALLNAGTNVCLGTDSASSNNDLDMIGEMRTASLIAKTTANNASALPAWQALEMATINGAKALNKQSDFGSLEVGKAADIVAIDLNHISTRCLGCRQSTCSRQKTSRCKYISTFTKNSQLEPTDIK